MKMKVAHQYDPLSGIYIGQVPAYESPLEPNKFLLPAHATFAAPAEAGPRQVAQWDGTAWGLVPDWRGHSYYTPNGEEITLNDIGIAPPADALTEPPPPTLGQRKLRAAAAVRRRADRIRRLMTDGASEYEIAGWGDKAAIAARSLAGAATASETASLEREAVDRGRGETAEQLAQRQLDLAGWYRLVRASIDGLRDAALDAIDAATAENLDATLAGLEVVAEVRINQLQASRP